MKTLRQVIKELQEFGEKNNALGLPCMKTNCTYCDSDLTEEINEIDILIRDSNDYIQCEATVNYKGPIVVL